MFHKKLNIIQHCDNVERMCRMVCYKNDQKKTNQKKRRKKKIPEQYLQTIIAQGEDPEQQHDTPPSLYLDHQQIRMLSFSSVVSVPSFDEFFLEVLVQL